MHDADPACEELVSAAHETPSALVTRLLHSDDPRTARLGRAIRAIQHDSTNPQPHLDDGARIVDPITHDPAW
ncbi:hypothetical protein AB0D11_27830 [Streptomyces monashensis]|uniref:hypothetical protein n=1 Tax=Streptomyces monashensis TaxID=1678012 RepID=UPI0033D40C32